LAAPIVAILCALAAGIVVAIFGGLLGSVSLLALALWALVGIGGGLYLTRQRGTAEVPSAARGFNPGPRRSPPLPAQ